MPSAKGGFSESVILVKTMMYVNFTVHRLEVVLQRRSRPELARR